MVAGADRVGHGGERGFMAPIFGKKLVSTT
jgi:hypothetical protein